MPLNFTPLTWVTGVPPVSQFNQQIRDPWNNLQAAWDTYEPAWTATTTNPDIGNGIITGRYKQVGKTITFEVAIVMGSTTTYGSGIQRISLPFLKGGGGGRQPMMGIARDVSASADYLIFGIVQNDTSVASLRAVVGTGAAGGLNSTSPFAPDVGDTLTIGGTYETG